MVTPLIVHARSDRCMIGRVETDVTRDHGRA